MTDEEILEKLSMRTCIFMNTCMYLALGFYQLYTSTLCRRNYNHPNQRSPNTVLGTPLPESTLSCIVHLIHYNMLDMITASKYLCTSINLFYTNKNGQDSCPHSFSPFFALVFFHCECSSVIF